MEPAKFVPVTKTASPASGLLTVTDRAAQEIKNALSSQSEAYAGIRVAVQAGGCCGVGYALAFAKTPDADDVVVESGGVKFYLNSSDSQLLKGSKIDFVDTPTGSGFHIDNPNQKTESHEHGGHGGCACGNGGGGCGCGSGGGHGEGHGSCGCQ